MKTKAPLLNVWLAVIGTCELATEQVPAAGALAPSLKLPLVYALCCNES